MPKKDYPNLNRASEVFYPSFFRHVDFYGKTGLRGWSSIYHRWRVVHHGTISFQIHARISKRRTTLFRHFGRMLHPVDIDYSDGHNFWLVES